MLVLAGLCSATGLHAAANAGPKPAGIRLIMVEDPSCRFCRRWNAEVGGIYATSPEGRFAPLQRVRREAPELAGLKPVVFTPTFILARGEQELGRIAGYPGMSFFWEELDELLKGAGFAPAALSAKPIESPSAKPIESTATGTGEQAP